MDIHVGQSFPTQSNRQVERTTLHPCSHVLSTVPEQENNVYVHLLFNTNTLSI